MARLSGIFSAMVTPFDATGTLRLDLVPALLEHHAACGLDGVVVGGTTGEAPSMSVGEREALLETTIRHRGGLRVIAGAGAASITDAIALTRHASAVGAEAALVAPPFFFKAPGAAGIANWYRAIVRAVDLPILLYSIPQFTAVKIVDETLDLLADEPLIVGIKDSEGDWSRLRTLIERRPNLAVFSGSDAHIGPALELGAAGAISGAANTFGALVAKIGKEFRAGRPTVAIQATLTAGVGVLLRRPFVPAVKATLTSQDLPAMSVRLPLEDLSAAEAVTVVDEVRRVGAWQA